MNGQIRIETRAFEVEDEHGVRAIVIHTQPVRVDEHGHASELPLGAEWRLRDGESVFPLSEDEFLGAHGKRWRRIA
ncbi:MAG: hypothetical protein QM741_08175 [Rudaea sp.]|uniref:hypothetical protein n=1 Tax=Rudaea sp. TaxID=2136325 RepID=UPI0039E24CF0